MSYSKREHQEAKEGHERCIDILCKQVIWFLDHGMIDDAESSMVQLKKQMRYYKGRFHNMYDFPEEFRGMWE